MSYPFKNVHLLQLQVMALALGSPPWPVEEAQKEFCLGAFPGREFTSLELEVGVDGLRLTKQGQQVQPAP